MNGKINIIFGFIYLAFTAVLGPALLIPQLEKISQSLKNTAAVVEKVREGVQNDFQGIETPDKVIAPAVVSIFDYIKTSKVSGKGVHAHGNLEAMLNIVAGLVLITLAIPANFKTLLSTLFLVGAVFHSGMLYLGGVFGMAWAYNFAVIGVIAIIAGLSLMGIACFIGIKQTQN